MGKSTTPPSTSRFLFGLSIVAIGVLFTLQNLGWVDADRIFSWLGEHWPVVFLGLGVGELFGRDRSWLGALIWFALGATFLSPPLVRNQILEMAIRYWPLGLVLLGLSVVAKALRGGDKAEKKAKQGSDSSSRVGIFALLATRRLRNASPSFQGGDLTSCLGSCEVDLRQAEIQGQAVLEIFAFWGGIEIIVPETWSVNLRVVPVMGGAEDASRSPKVPTGEELVVKGLTFMGGVNVRN